MNALPLGSFSSSLRAALTAALLVLVPVGAFALDEGEAAPAFDAPLLDSAGTLSLANYRGKVVYLDFWASWCKPCAVSLPLLDELRGEFPPALFQVVAVNVDSDPKRGRRFLKRNPVGYPSASDPEGALPERFGVRTMPTAYLIDAEGVIRHVHSGFQRSDVKDLRRRIGRLVKESR